MGRFGPSTGADGAGRFGPPTGAHGGAGRSGPPTGAHGGVTPSDPPTAPVTGLGDPPTRPFAAGGAGSGAGSARDGSNGAGRGRHRSTGAGSAGAGFAGAGSEEDADGAGPTESEESAEHDESSEPAQPTLLEQMGGASGMVASAVPVVAFVVAQAVASSLTVSVVVAVAAAVLIAGWRMVRGEPLQPALAGLFGVGVCAFVAYRTGDAKGFYLPGIITSVAYGTVFLISVLVRWPLVGVAWHLLNGQGQGWRASPELRRAFDLASLAWVLVFAARAVVQGWLYGTDYADDWLGWVRLAMGIPLAILAALVTLWAIRKSQARAA